MALYDFVTFRRDIQKAQHGCSDVTPARGAVKSALIYPGHYALSVEGVGAWQRDDDLPFEVVSQAYRAGVSALVMRPPASMEMSLELLES